MQDFIEKGLSITIFGNAVAGYVVTLLTWVGLAICLMCVKQLIAIHLGRLAAKTANDFDDFLVGLINQIGWPVFIAVSLYAATLPLYLADPVRLAVRYLLIIALTVRSALLGQAILAYAIQKRCQAVGASDASSRIMAKNLASVLRWVLWAVAIIFLLDNLGIKISTFVAGLGIGGVAVALAAQAILGDLFSSFSIFIDKPFAVGDFIVLDDFMGTIEHIGLKTTRIRSLHGEQLIFSNTDLTKSRIRNYKRMDTRRIAFKIGVVYQTASVQVRKIPELIKNICAEIGDIKLDRVHFAAFGDFSLIYEIVYYVLSADYNVYMDKQQEINLRLKDVFEREKIEFAYPTQTLYLSH